MNELRAVEIDEGLFYGSPHRHRAIEQIREAIAADVPNQVDKMTAEGWPAADALALVRRWWLTVAREAIREGVDRARMADEVLA